MRGRADHDHFSTALALRLLGLAQTHAAVHRPVPHRSTPMYPTSRFETRLSDLRASMKLRALVADLQSQVQFLDANIRDEEQRTGISDVANVAYPILAKNLRGRRDNLLATIRVLESHLAETAVAA
jgi:hypothetical protein